MERRKQTRGACTYCGRTLTRSGMRRHLEACPKRKAQLAEADDGTGTRRTFLHLDVRDAYDGDYWLHLEMEGSGPPSTLDAYLRHIWLECCGHLSEFSIGRRRRHREVDMARPAGQIFRPGVELTHVYDFGTSTVTTIRLAGERRGKATSRWPLVLMARNDAPELECHACGQPARWFCHDRPRASRPPGRAAAAMAAAPPCVWPARSDPRRRVGSPTVDSLPSRNASTWPDRRLVTQGPLEALRASQPPGVGIPALACVPRPSGAVATRPADRSDARPRAMLSGSPRKARASVGSPNISRCKVTPYASAGVRSGAPRDQPVLMGLHGETAAREAAPTLDATSPCPRLRHGPVSPPFPISRRSPRWWPSPA